MNKKTKWMFIIGFCLFIVIFNFVMIYHASLKEERALQKEAIERVKAQMQIQLVKDVEHYHGIEAYHIVEADTEDGTYIFFVPDDKKHGIVKVKKESILPKSKVIEKVQKEKQPQKIIDVRYAINNSIPLWEIVYEGSHNERTYFYITIDKGMLYKRYTISK
jgi:uncharacterized protein YpmB